MQERVDRTAQRRPGPRPRQHLEPPPTSMRDQARSTKAGASTPATHADEGRPPRSHPRSTKAGASTPATPMPMKAVPLDVIRAQRRPGPRPRQHRRQGPCATKKNARSTKAGASTPATPGSMCAGRTSSRALNEGRGLDPGNTCVAARRPPALPPLNEGRGLDPGNTSGLAGSGRRRRSLNEGRGLDPGNTPYRATSGGGPADAQRRPGPRPRQHCRSGRCSSAAPSALNEGRGLDPGNTTIRTA